MLSTYSAIPVLTTSSIIWPASSVWDVFVHSNTPIFPRKAWCTCSFVQAIKNERSPVMPTHQCISTPQRRFCLYCQSVTWEPVNLEKKIWMLSTHFAQFSANQLAGGLIKTRPKQEGTFPFIPVGWYMIKVSFLQELLPWRHICLSELFRPTSTSACPIY